MLTVLRKIFSLCQLLSHSHIINFSLIKILILVVNNYNFICLFNFFYIYFELTYFQEYKYKFL